MIYLPPLKSLKDLLLWPFRLVFNLPIQEQALLGLILTVPLLVLTLFSGSKQPADRTVDITETVSLKIGALDNRKDSLRLYAGTPLRLLARQGKLVWVETEDGRYRGFVEAKNFTGDARKTLEGLPNRRWNSRYYISKQKFEALMDTPGLTREALERNWIHAEYLQPDGRGMSGEFGFHVVDSVGTQFRPVIQFARDGSVNDYHLEFWHSKRAIRFGSAIDLFSPLISIAEFRSFSPFDHGVTNLIWTYLIGYLPLFLFVLLLWARKPLIWMPNVVANLCITALITIGPFTWCMLLRVQGIAWWPLIPVTVLCSLVGCFLFWNNYSGLRCPRCKHLIGHEYQGTLLGNTYTEVKRNQKAVSRKNLKHRTSSWEHKRVEVAQGRYEVRGVLTHFYEDEVTYEIFETRSLLQRLTRKYACPKCGHGRDKQDVKVLESETKPVGRHTTVERYTRKQIEGIPFNP